MPEKSEIVPTTLAEVLDRMARNDFALNFDVTLEFNTPSLRVGSVRLHGRVEAVPPRKK